MSWTMLTSTALEVPIGRPREHHIDALDIAHHLSQINRYCGAAVRPISVAEHSLLVCEIAERDLGVRSPAALQCFLLHDAHEAILGDITSPVKLTLSRLDNGALHIVEQQLQAAVMARFDLRAAWAAWHERVRHADLMALATERRDLLPYRAGLHSPWAVLHGIEPAGWINLRDRDGMTWRDWRTAFLDKLGELSMARRLQASNVPGDHP